MKKKLLIILGCVVAFVGLEYFLTHEWEKPPPRKRPAFNFLTMDEFDEILEHQNKIFRTADDDEEAEQAAIMAHLAEEGFRLGYQSGMEYGLKACNGEESEESHVY
jgi:hypothetical protein